MYIILLLLLYYFKAYETFLFIISIYYIFIYSSRVLLYFNNLKIQIIFRNVNRVHIISTFVFYTINNIILWRGVAWRLHSVRKRVLSASISRCHWCPDGWPPGACHTYTHLFRPNRAPPTWKNSQFTKLPGLRSIKKKKNMTSMIHVSI